MKSVSVFAVFLLGVLVEFSVDAAELGGCKGVNDPEQHMWALKECMDAAKISKIADLDPMSAGCFSKCVMEKKGFIDAAGKAHKEVVMKGIGEYLPASLLPAYKTAAEACLENEGSQIKVPDDEFCHSYMPLAMCFHMAFLDICQ